MAKAAESAMLRALRTVVTEAAKQSIRAGTASNIGCLPIIPLLAIMISIESL